MQLIPWILLKQAITIQGDGTRPDTPVTMPNRVFQLLMEAALKGQAFDEKQYLVSNPDVARSVREGKYPSGRDHFVSTGYYEDRPLGDAGFEEEWYLRRYPDVKKAVLMGECMSGHVHFTGSGVREWRSPNKAAEPDIMRWHLAVTESVKSRQASPPLQPRRARQAPVAQVKANSK
jgi:hypothetical protein